MLSSHKHATFVSTAERRTSVEPAKQHAYALCSPHTRMPEVAECHATNIRQDSAIVKSADMIDIVSSRQEKNTVESYCLQSTCRYG